MSLWKSWYAIQLLQQFMEIVCALNKSAQKRTHPVWEGQEYLNIFNNGGHYHYHSFFANWDDPLWSAVVLVLKLSHGCNFYVMNNTLNEVSEFFRPFYDLLEKLSCNFGKSFLGRFTTVFSICGSHHCLLEKNYLFTKGQAGFKNVFPLINEITIHHILYLVGLE